MSIRTVALASLVSLLAFLALTVGTGAMEIQEFDRMSNDQQATYVSEMIASAIGLLQRQGRTKEAHTVAALFTNGRGKTISTGMEQFFDVLESGRLSDQKRAKEAKERLHVEDTLAVMLKRNDIVIMAADLRAAVTQDRAAATQK